MQMACCSMLGELGDHDLLLTAQALFEYNTCNWQLATEYKTGVDPQLGLALPVPAGSDR